MAKKNEKKKTDDLQDIIARLQQDVQINMEGWQRARADYANLKKEGEDRQRQLVLLATEQLFDELLPSIDLYRRALLSAPDAISADDWFVGVEQIKKQFDEILKKRGVEIIPTVGEPFNPAVHDALAEETVEGKISGTIIQEVSGGYTLSGKVILPAKVIVAK